MRKDKQLVKERRHLCAPLLFSSSILAFLSLSTTGLLLGCNQNKKKADSKPAAVTPEPSVQSSATPVSSPAATPPAASPPATTDGSGTNPPFVGTGDLKPSDVVTPQSGNNLPAQMNEIGKLIYGYNFPFDNYTLEGFEKSALEARAEVCMNEYLAQVRFVREPSGRVVSVSPDRTVFEGCMNAQKIEVASKWQTSFRFNMNLNCSGNVVTDLNGVTVVQDRWVKGYCDTGVSSTVRYNIEIEAKQLDAQDSVLRYFKRTKALTNRSGGDCGWTWSEAEKIKTFTDCVFLDRIDGNNKTSTRFVMVAFDRVVGHQSESGGFLYTGGTASVIFNNFQGQITFKPVANGIGTAPTWSMTKAGSTTQVTGTLTVPPGHGIMPTSFPNAGGGGVTSPTPSGVPSVSPGAPTPSPGGAYVPVIGPGNTQELRCSSLVTPQNVEVDNGLGNGVVSLYRAEVGGKVYHAGYVHENQSAAKQAFLAKFENNQLVWCRTYVVANQGDTEAAFVGDLGNGQFYAGFVARQTAFAAVGNAYQKTRVPQDKPVAYIVHFDPFQGNVYEATWFDFIVSPSGSFSTLVLDSSGLSAGQVRLRAFLTATQAPGCDRVGTGNYGIVMAGNLSGIVGNAAEFCPLQN